MKKFLLSIFAVLFAFAGVQAQNYVYKKVTSAPSDWSGDYLIVYEAGNVAFNGSLSKLDATSNTISVSISNNEIVANATTNAAKFTIAKSGDSYTIKNVGGYYIGAQSDGNTLLSSLSEMLNTISWEDGSPKIVGAKGAVLRYNATSGQTRFRYFKSGTYKNQKAIALYKYTEESTGPEKPAAPTFTAGGNFVGSIEVEISCATEGAAIYYTTDGSEPTEDSEVYSDPFKITETTTVKAIAVNEGGASGVATAVYTRVAATPVIKFEGEASAFEGEVVVSIETENNAVAYYTLNGVAPSASSTVYEEPITIKANVTLKVIAIEVGEYKSDVKTQEFIMAVAGGEGENCTLSFADKAQRTTHTTSQQVWEQNGVTLTNNKGKSTSNVGDYAAPARFYKNSEIIVEFTSPIAKIEFACNTTAYATALKKSISGASVVVNGKIVTVLLDGTSNSFAVTLSADQVRMDALTVTAVAKASAFDLNVTEAGWATLYLGYDAVIPADVACYVISEVGTESVQLEEVTGVLPANTAVIVEATKGEYTFDVVEDNTEEIENIMLGTTMNKYITEEAYVLGIVDGEVGLYKAEMAGGVWLNNANKAYLPMPAGAEGIKSYSFRFGEGTTGVEEVKTENGEVKTIFDLTGRRVEVITAPGIYIVGGKKVLVK